MPGAVDIGARPSLRAGAQRSGRLVGRAKELALLVSALEAAREGHARTATVCGEPGIGKTRLAEELAAVAAGEGFHACWVRCYEGAESPDYGPWARWLRHVVDELGTAAVSELAGSGAAWLSHMLPELRGADAPPKVDGGAGSGARLRVFEAFAALLQRLARERPRLILIDDLQWSDPASAHLFGFLSRELDGAAACIVATCRSTDVAPEDAVTAVLGDMRRVATHTDLTLGGLDADEVTKLVADLVSADTATAVAGIIGRRTRGNPFFILELLRQVAEELDAAAGIGQITTIIKGLPAIPLQVHEVIKKRLCRVGGDCRDLLTMAAIVGEDFELRELEQSAGLGRDAVVALLDEAADARLIASQPPNLGGYCFEHALIRDVLSEGLGATERSRRHQAVLEAIEALHRGAEDAYIDRLAFHSAEAALTGSAQTAIAYAQRAATRALANLGFEKAVRHYERILSLLGLAAEPNDVARCEALLGLAVARHAAGDGSGSDRAFAEAFELADAMVLAGNEEAKNLLGRAALGIPDSWGRSGVFERERAARLERALEEVRDQALRSALLGRLAAAYHWTDRVDHREELSTQAVSLARRCGEPRALAYALLTRRFATWSVDRIDEHLEIAEEIVALGRSSGDRDVEMTGIFWRIIDGIERDDMARVERDIASYTAYAEESGLPYYRWYAGVVRATRATMSGDMESAFAAAEAARALGSAAGIADAEQFFGAQMMALARLSGTVGLLADEIAKVVEQTPGLMAWRAAYAGSLAAAGRETEARRQLAVVARKEFADLPRDGSFLTACSLLADAMFLLADAPRAAVVYRFLLPFADRHVIAGNAAAYFGSVQESLGLLAQTMGRIGDAREHFIKAYDGYRHIGAAPFAERVQGYRDSLEAAAGEQSAGTGSASVSSGDTVSVVTTEACEEALFQRHGEIWTISFCGRTVRMRDTKGLRYLAILLAEPGREHHVLDLLVTVSAAGAVEREQIHADSRGGAGAVLDPRAKADYRRRIVELRERLEQAEGDGDLGHAELARVELETLTQQLAAAVGLGGRDRSAALGAERARVNVTRAVHSALKRLDGEHPELAAHLRATVRTGTFCRYEPDPRVATRWNSGSGG